MSTDTLEVKAPEQETINVAALPQDDLKTALKGKPEEEVKAPDTELGNEEKTDEVKAPVPDEKIEISKTEFEKLQKQVADKEAFIQRQATEVGDTRKKIQELETTKTQLEEKLNEVWHEGGVEAAKAMKDFNEASSALTDAQMSERKAIDREFVLKAVPDFEAKIPAMVEILKKDGISEANIAQFQKDPYHFNPDEIIQVGRRVNEVKTISDKDAEIQRLTAEIEKLKKKPGEILQTIEESASRSSGQGKSSLSSQPLVSAKSIYSMPSEELAKVRKGG